MSSYKGVIGPGALQYLAVLGMYRWTECLFLASSLAQGAFFELPELAQGALLSFQFWAPEFVCILLISIHYVLV